MNIIEKQYYPNFYSIFKELGSYTFFLSALDQIVDGQLYADDNTNPTYALMLTADLNYIAGDLSSDEFAKSIFKISQSDEFLDFTGFIFNVKHKERIEEIFGLHTHTFVHRNNYQLEKENFVKTSSIQEGELVRITPESITDFREYDHYKAVFDECQFYWDEFKSDSQIKYANILVKDQSIMSLCYLCGESSFENSAELGIETFKPFQRKGLAEYISRVTINELLDLGFERINWHCHSDNIGSAKTALKLGFSCVDESYLAWFKKKI